MGEAVMFCENFVDFINSKPLVSNCGEFAIIKMTVVDLFGPEYS
jgi:hypothetical protein